MRVGVIAGLRIKPGMNAGFEAAFRRFQLTVRASESGVIYFALHRSRTDPQSYSVMEQYRDQQGLNEHRQTPHYLAIPATFGEFMAGPPDIREYDAIE